MKLKLLLIASAAMIISSCSKNNDELPIPQTTETGEEIAAKKKEKPFNGVLTLHPDATAQLSCGCAPGFFEIGPFSGSGVMTDLGFTTAITTPCVGFIPNGLHADTQCVTFVSANGDELYMVAAAPYDNVLNPVTNLITGTGTFNITGGTGKYQDASGSYSATVINNQLIAPAGTPPTVITIITGSIIY